MRVFCSFKTGLAGVDLPAVSFWSAEGHACLEQLQPVADQRAHSPVVIAQPPDLSTNKSGEISPNLIKIDNDDETMMLNAESVTRNDQLRHISITTRHEISLSVAWCDVAVAQVTRYDTALA